MTPSWCGCRRLSPIKSETLQRLARLEAEQSDSATIKIPPKLLALVGSAQSEELINAQRSALVSRRTALDAKRAALARAAEIANRELSGLTAQAERVEVQLNRSRDYKEKIDDLQSKGVVNIQRSFEESSRVSDLEDRSTNTAVAIARVQGVLAALERDRVNLEQERRSEIDTEIIKLGRDIAQLDIEIDAARLTYRKLTGMEPPMSLVISERAKEKALAVKYEIVRQSPAGLSTLKSDQADAAKAWRHHGRQLRVTIDTVR